MSDLRAYQCHCGKPIGVEYNERTAFGVFRHEVGGNQETLNIEALTEQQTKDELTAWLVEIHNAVREETDIGEKLRPVRYRFPDTSGEETVL